MPSNASELVCQEFYKELLTKGDGEYKLSASVYYGWLNQEVKTDSYRPKLYDLSHERRQKLVEDLIRPCPASGPYHLCGFKLESKSNATGPVIALSKPLEASGQEITFDGLPVKMYLSLNTVDSEEDRHPPKRGKRKYDEMAKDWFDRVKEGIKGNGLVLIWSHSRGGAGPDPYPYDDSLSGSIKYAYNSIHKSNINRIFPEHDDLVGSRILILASCTSEKCFGDSVRDRINQYSDGKSKFHTGLTTKFLHDYQGELTIRSMISSLSQGYCPDQIEKSHSNPDGYSPLDHLQLQWSPSADK
jgi:hypothetical protein